MSFDVGGTLLEPWPSVGQVYSAVALECGLPRSDPGLLNLRFREAWRNKEDFDYSREAWARVVARTFGDEINWAAGSPFFQQLYERFAQKSVWRVYEDVLPILQNLRCRGLKLAIVSNWDDRLRPLLRNLELDQYFCAIAVSVELGCHKPAPQIFHRIASDLKLSADAVLHVGDGRVEDFEGARGAGMRSLLLIRGAAPMNVKNVGGVQAGGTGSAEPLKVGRIGDAQSFGLGNPDEITTLSGLVDLIGSTGLPL